MNKTEQQEMFEYFNENIQQEMFEYFNENINIEETKNINKKDSEKNNIIFESTIL